MTERSMQFKRVGNDGVLTEHRADGTWKSIVAPMDEWDKVAEAIISAMRDRARNVVPLRGQGPKGAA